MSNQIKVAVCQINPTVGDVEGNFRKIFDFYNQSISKGAELVVFPELISIGYPPQDLLYNSKLIEKNIELLQSFSKQSTIPAIIGYVNSVGGKIYNSAAVCSDGKIDFSYDKMLLPNYDIFDEKRYFISGKSIGEVKIKIGDSEQKVVLQICEDLWEDLHDSKLSSSIEKLNPDLIINISASPFSNEKINSRIDLIKKHYSKTNCPFIYCNLVGAQDEIIFDGNSLIFDKDYKLISKGKSFQEDLLISNLVDFEDIKILSTEENLFNALSLGIRDYFIKSGHMKAVIGLSGGIDSALVAILTVNALGKDNVSLISLPSRFSSDHSKIDALMLAQNLECNFQTIDIDPIFQSYINELEAVFENQVQSIVFENIQSRIRGNLLMALSNNDNALVVSTGNKTELALGYSTIYGDMIGSILPIGDLTKIEVYNLCEYINKQDNLIPQNILDKTPSAELSPNQVDPFDYEYISPIIDKFITSNHNTELSSSFKKLILRNEFKRRQAPIILRVSSKSFGVGRRMPIINSFNE